MGMNTPPIVPRKEWDAAREEMLVLRRVRGKWSRRTVPSGEPYTTRLFPNLIFDVASVYSSSS